MSTNTKQASEVTVSVTNINTVFESSASFFTISSDDNKVKPTSTSTSNATSKVENFYPTTDQNLNVTSIQPNTKLAMNDLKLVIIVGTVFGTTLIFALLILRLKSKKKRMGRELTKNLDEETRDIDKYDPNNTLGRYRPEVGPPVLVDNLPSSNSFLRQHHLQLADNNGTCQTVNEISYQLTGHRLNVSNMTAGDTAYQLNENRKYVDA
ncbi:hypothetical protein HK099_003398, partial [Clydaea vesicula]